MKEPELKIEQKEKEKKYELPEGNIVALDENSEIRKRNENYYKGLKEEGVVWPVEIQGGGLSDYEKKEFKIWYPVGDIFVSFNVAIHELGHLRQGEINENFSKKNLGAPNPDEKKAKEFDDEIEEDAWQRGWERAKKYCPEELKIIEDKFQEYKRQGKFSEFNNYEDFYKHDLKVASVMWKFNDIINDPQNPSFEEGKMMGKLIKGNKLTNEFFTQQDNWRTGEKIDRDFTESFIKKAAEKIVEEEY